MVVSYLVEKSSHYNLPLMCSEKNYNERIMCIKVKSGLKAIQQTIAPMV